MSRTSMPSAARRTSTPAKLRLDHTDVGKRLSWEEFAKADWEEGYQYEVIDGRLTVSPLPEIDHADFNDWILQSLIRYADRHSDVINRVAPNARVVVPDRPGLTVPQPDLAAYQGFPSRRARPKGFSWRSVSPILVVEVLSPDNHDKDTARNVGLYELVPSIREYWIVDALEGDDHATLTVYRRRGDRWQKPIVVKLGEGETYATKLLPGFRLRLDTNA